MSATKQKKKVSSWINTQKCHQILLMPHNNTGLSILLIWKYQADATGDLIKRRVDRSSELKPFLRPNHHVWKMIMFKGREGEKPSFLNAGLVIEYRIQLNDLVLRCSHRGRICAALFLVKAHKVSSSSRQSDTFLLALNYIIVSKNWWRN